MKIKKRNIEFAIGLSAVSLLMYIFFHFSSEEQLLIIGQRIERIIGIPIAIQVNHMQTFLTTILSGIFASTLVALVFYIQDYQREKEVLFKKAMNINSDICKIYREIPYLDYLENNDSCSLARGYYVEYYRNKYIQEMKSKNDEYLKQFPKTTRNKLQRETQPLFQTSSEKKESLLSFLKAARTQASSENAATELPDDDTILEDIIKNIDYKTQKAREVYKRILETDLSELEEIIDEIVSWKCYSFLRCNFLRKGIKDETIFPALFLKPKDVITLMFTNAKQQPRLFDKINALSLTKGRIRCSNNTVVSRILEMHKRGLTFIQAMYDLHNLGSDQPHSSTDMLQGLQALQHVFLGTDKMRINTKGEELLEIPFSFNKFAYYALNLNRILLLDLTGRYEFAPLENFAMLADRFEEGKHIYTQSFSGDAINPDIYRL